MGHAHPPDRIRRPGQEAGGRPNSLGMDGKQLDALLSRVDGHGGGASDRRRRFVRWPFRRTTVDLQISHPGGSAITCRVACRNLSCGGVSVMHSAFLYPGSACVVHLTRPDGAVVAIGGVILRCIHLQGMVHEIGIKFDREISVNEFRDSDPTAGQFSLETIDPAMLAGVVMHAEPSELERKLVQHYLRGTALQLQAALNPEQAGAIARAGCDVILCGDQRNAPGAEPILSAARAVLPALPVVGVLAESSPAGLERVRRLRIDALLVKPFDDTTLLRALGEFLLVRRTPGERAPGAPAPGECATDLTGLAQSLESALEGEDAAACYVACEQVTTAARATRLAALEHLAQKASASLSSTMSTEKSRQPVLDLIAACPRRAAA